MGSCPPALPLALQSAAQIFEKTGAEHGVVWVITDNRDDRGTDNTAANTREFGRILQEDPHWQIVLGYPIVEADWIESNTLIVYGLYYSKREEINDLHFRSWTDGTDRPLSIARVENHAKNYLSKPCYLRADSPFTKISRQDESE